MQRASTAGTPLTVFQVVDSGKKQEGYTGVGGDYECVATKILHAQLRSNRTGAVQAEQAEREHAHALSRASGQELAAVPIR